MIQCYLSGHDGLEGKVISLPEIPRKGQLIRLDDHSYVQVVRMIMVANQNEVFIDVEYASRY